MDSVIEVFPVTKAPTEQTLWAEKIQSTTDAGSLNTFGRNEIEVAPIPSALLRIASLVILYKTCRVLGPRTRSRCLEDNIAAVAHHLRA